MTGKEFQKHYESSGYEWTETSHFCDRDFAIVQDHGLGEGRRGVQGEIESEDGDRLVVSLSFYDEHSSHGDQWHETVVGTVGEIVEICGRAIEDGVRPPKSMIKAA